MTEVELFENLNVYSDVNGVLQVPFDELVEFLSDKVIITKGTNRHPDADVLHEWIEGAEIQRASIDTITWFDIDTTIDAMLEEHVSVSGPYRIKPSEPIYEAVVRIRYADGSYEDTQKYFTYEEFKNFGFPKSCTWIESTKRERKQ